MKLRSALLGLGISCVLAGCNGGTAAVPAPHATSTPTPPPFFLGTGNPRAYQTAAYVDAFASGSLARITPSGWGAPTVLLVGFADPTTTSVSPTIANALASGAANRSTSTLANRTFLSIGGASVSPASWPQSPSTLASNLLSQINAYNLTLSGHNLVVGVDLDLENGFSASTISALAHALHGLMPASGVALMVAIAPQIVGVSGPTVDATNPVNLGLSPGGFNDNFGPAIAAGDVDYLLAQAYNTGPTGIAIANATTSGGVSPNAIDESSPLFYQAASQALNSAVRASCSGSVPLCIPAGTQIFVGEPANQGAGGTYTMFNPSAPQPTPVAYDQAAILSTLSSELGYMFVTNPAPYGNVTGISMWALGNDYAPALYGDTHAVPGAFSTAIAGASPAPPGPSILLQLTNNGSASSIVTLISSGSYYPFPAVGPSSNATWCTQAASETYGCADSGTLDTIGAGTVTIQVTTGATAWLCPAGSGIGAGGTVALTGGRYNLQVNGDYESCAFGSF